MSIQQSINQAIGIAGALATQTPMAAAHKEKVLNKEALKEEEKNLKSKLDALHAVKAEVKETKDIHTYGVGNEALQDIKATTKRLQELDPKKYTDKYVKTATIASKVDEAYKDWQEAEQKEKIKSEQKKEAKNARRRAQYALKKAEAERQAKADIKTRIMTNINKWGETNG